MPMSYFVLWSIVESNYFFMPIRMTIVEKVWEFLSFWSRSTWKSRVIFSCSLFVLCWQDDSEFASGIPVANLGIFLHRFSLLSKTTLLLFQFSAISNHLQFTFGSCSFVSYKAERLKYLVPRCKQFSFVKYTFQ